MLDLSNLKIAYSYKNNIELKRSILIFKTINSPIILFLLKNLTTLSLNLKIPINFILKPTVFKVFCGGETINQANNTATHLAKYGVNSILDYSIEGNNNEESFNNAYKNILNSIEFTANNTHLPFSVFKITALADINLLEKIQKNEELTELELSTFNLLKNRINNLSQKAFDLNTPLMIDAEESWIQNLIDEITLELMSKFNKNNCIIYNTLQCYRKDSLDNLIRWHKISLKENFKLGVKFVRGAYMEKERLRASDLLYPSPINETKAQTDKCYDHSISYALEHIERINIFAGTHNEKSIRLICKLMETYKINNSDKRVFFSQLYGMGDNISFNLATKNYNVAKYLPYGPVKYVIPYLMRRAEENSSINGQSSRELLLLKNELRRRKSK